MHRRYVVPGFVAGVAMIVGSCLRWLTVTLVLPGHLHVDVQTTTGLRDLGYKTGYILWLGLGCLTLLGGLLIVISTGFEILRGRLPQPWPYARLGAAVLSLVIAVAACLSIARHGGQGRVPSVHNEIGFGLWLTTAACAVATVTGGLAIFGPRGPIAATEAQALTL